MSGADEALPVTPVTRLPLAERFGRGWRVALWLSLLGIGLLLWQLVLIVWRGLGHWGTNQPFVWGFDLVNYMWWIGIANGGGLFAALLVVRRHSLRTAVNRVAEAVALATVFAAALYPIFHLGRPLLFYWVFPYPATFEVWPQFRSPLIWDMWSILAHVLVTGLLWVVGLVPDLATLRDRARRPLAQKVYGLLALGWRGSSQHWAAHQMAYRLVAGLMIPLMLLTQSVVALEFAATIVPLWHQVRLPLQFVVTGLVGGIAVLLLTAQSLRAAFGLGRYVTDEHELLMIRLLRSTGIAILVLYAEEIFSGYVSDLHTRSATGSRIFGEFAAFYWLAILLMGVLPQLYWWDAARRLPALVAALAAGVLLGIWFDRWSLVASGPYSSYLPYGNALYSPSFTEWALFLGTLALFFAWMLVFVRWLPVVSLFEARHAEREARDL